MTAPATSAWTERFVRAALRRAETTGVSVRAAVAESAREWKDAIDATVGRQLDAILHHPKLQRLEGTLRGLHYLVSQSETGEKLKLKVLNVNKKTLEKDREKAVEFDQMALFKKVYELEYGPFGGQPYGMLVADYEFGNHPTEDFELIKRISAVAAAAHAPFVAAAGPAMFGWTSFEEMHQPRDLAKIFEQSDYITWKSFRDSEDSRYVALTVPRVLARLPYGPHGQPVAGFDYTEDVSAPNRSSFAWMSAAWVYAARVTAAFARDGWFMRTRGYDDGGRAEGLPVYPFEWEGRMEKCSVPDMISHNRPVPFSDLGFLPIQHCRDTEFSVFLYAQTCNKPKEYVGPQGDAAKANAKLSSRLTYLLCMSRFAHAVKVRARNMIGRMMDAFDIRMELNDWITGYFTDNPDQLDEVGKAKWPLRGDRIEVVRDQRNPGSYNAVLYLRPHYQMEELKASLRLVVALPRIENF